MQNGFGRELEKMVCDLHDHQSRWASNAWYCLARKESERRALLSRPEQHSKYESVVHIAVVRSQAGPIVHEALLCDSAAWFAEVLRENIRNARTKRLNLPEESVRDIALFLSWLYVGDFVNPCRRCVDFLLGSNQGSCPESIKDQLIPDCCVDLSIFGECAGAPTLQNAVMDEIVRRADDGSPLLSSAERVIKASQNLSPSSPLIHYLIEESAYWWATDREFGQARNLEQMPPDFITQLTRRVIARRTPGHRARPAWRDDLCAFHQHADGAERSSCKNKRSRKA